MREWLVAGALIEGPEGLLLVCNQRAGGRVDWTPPGGVVDPGESVLDGLRREVSEETGLQVDDWDGLLYRVEAEAPDMAWHLRVEVWRAASWSGELVVGDDPDGIVVDATFAHPELCARHLATGPPWVSEPVGEWLSSPWQGERQFGYSVLGRDLASLEVTRR